MPTLTPEPQGTLPSYLLFRRKKNFFAPHLPPSTPLYLQLRSPVGLTTCSRLWLIMVLCYPAMTNPYTFPPTLPSGTSHFSVLDLKDTFFISFNTQSQNIFVFTWTDPNTQLYCPTSQGFRDSPHLFGQAPASDLFSLSLSPNRNSYGMYMTFSSATHPYKLAKLTPLLL